MCVPSRCRRSKLTSGTYFDIKEFALYDGPGVRQTVFLKGCPLRCTWCHNPEGQSFAPQLYVSPAACCACGRCASACPDGLLTDGIYPAEGCKLCGCCISVCPLGIRKICGRTVSAVEMCDMLLRDSELYAGLGGGVTFSGGEPLSQPGFLFECADILKTRGVQLAIETCGHCAQEIFEKALCRFDIMLFDIKSEDPHTHLKYTGVTNEIILANYFLLKSYGLPHIVRIPLIPGVNDSDLSLEATASLLLGDKSLLRVELLPYHKTAGAKYGAVGREYLPRFDTDSPVHADREIFTKYGMECEVL